MDFNVASEIPLVFNHAHLADEITLCDTLERPIKEMIIISEKQFKEMKLCVRLETEDLEMRSNS